MVDQFRVYINNVVKGRKHLTEEKADKIKHILFLSDNNLTYYVKFLV